MCNKIDGLFARASHRSVQWGVGSRKERPLSPSNLPISTFPNDLIGEIVKIGVVGSKEVDFGSIVRRVSSLFDRETCGIDSLQQGHRFIND